MDSARIDDLVRSWDRRSRRAGLRWFAGGVVGGALILLGAPQGEAKKKKRPKKKPKKKDACGGKCPQGFHCCPSGFCCPADIPVCCPYGCCPADPHVFCSDEWVICARDDAA
jgi:hypothetical protein